MASYLFIIVCNILSNEKREHGQLKETWQMANDQFLESQRLMMMDMRRMESLLSSEQQRQLTGVYSGKWADPEEGQQDTPHP